MTQPTPVKVIIHKTNFNNRLLLNKMLVVDRAPKELGRHVWENTVYEIRTEDNSYPPSKWKLVDICRLPFGSLTSVYTWASHGMDFADYCLYVKETQPEINTETPMCLYLYTQI